MQAVVIDEYCSADKMALREIEKPAAAVHEIVVKVHAASINPVDWKVRRGDVRLLVSRKFPKVVGVDFAGTIEQVGSGLKKAKVGDAVFGMCNPLRTQFGSYGEFAIIEADAFAIKPPQLTFADAAAIPVAGLTALKALRDLIDLQSGQKLLINGASGGVGAFAVQLAKLLGSQVVATCSAANIDFVRGLGADQVLDYAQDDVQKLSDKFHGIFDASAKLSFGQVRHLLTDNGTYVTTVPGLAAALDMITTAIIPGRKSKMVLASGGGNVANYLSELAAMVVSGRLQTNVTKTISLAELPATHKAAEAGHNRGKFVVRIIDQ